jgi:predicted small secreted protein
MQQRTYTDLKALIQALAGVSSFTTEEDAKIVNLVNRRASQAYNSSPSWSRYLVVSQERNITTGNLIPFTQSGLPTIDEFVRIHRTQAFLNNSALEYDFYVDANGANILNIINTDDTTAFCTYKKQLPVFTADSNDLGDVDNSIPGEFFNFLAHATYADFLRMDGQHGKALTEEQIAQSYLDSELEKIDIRNNNNSLNHKFSTYVNRQSR